jgi:hypothetical protein
VDGLTNEICPLLYRKQAEVPNVAKIDIFLEALPATIESYTEGTTVHLGTIFIQDYLAARGASETRYELLGLLTHYFSHMYQHIDAPTGVLTGVNDFVRYRTGYFRLTNRKKGGAWDDGFQTTGFFFDYIERQFPGFIYEFNGRLAVGYDVSLFRTLTGKDVLTLWSDYQASF